MQKKRSKRKRYPKNWKQQATACKQHAQWQCETCNEAQFTWKVSKRTGLMYRMRLHAAHIGRYTMSPQLKALCPSCHAKLDWQRRKAQTRLRMEQLKHQMLLTLRS
jgi:hypothetical protein